MENILRTKDRDIIRKIERVKGKILKYFPSSKVDSRCFEEQEGEFWFFDQFGKFANEVKLLDQLCENYKYDIAPFSEIDEVLLGLTSDAEQKKMLERRMLRIKYTEAVDCIEYQFKAELFHMASLYPELLMRYTPMTKEELEGLVQYKKDVDGDLILQDGTIIEFGDKDADEVMGELGAKWTALSVCFEFGYFHHQDILSRAQMQYLWERRNSIVSKWSISQWESIWRVQEFMLRIYNKKYEAAVEVLKTKGE